MARHTATNLKLNPQISLPFFALEQDSEKLTASTSTDTGVTAKYVAKCAVFLRNQYATSVLKSDLIAELVTEFRRLRPPQLTESGEEWAAHCVSGWITSGAISEVK